MPVVIHHGRLTAPCGHSVARVELGDVHGIAAGVERNADDLFRGRHHARSGA